MTNKKKPRSSLARLVALALMIALLLGCALSVTGCFAFVPETPDADDDPDAITEGDQSGENGADDEQKPSLGEDDASVLTYEQFVAQYPQLARQFALDRLDELSYADDVLSTSYAYVASGEKISQLLIANVVIAGETERQLKIATFEFVGGLRVQDIACGKDLPTVTTRSENALTFDAKEEFFKQNFTIKAQIDAKIEQNLGTAAVEITSYQIEEFEPDVQLPTTVAQMVAEYPDKVNEVLNEHFLDNALKTGRTTSLDASKVHDAKWYLNGSNEVTSLDFVFHYTISDTAKTLYVINLAFDDNATIDDILNNSTALSNIKTTRTSSYSFGYNPSVQGTRDELMNAIAETCGLPKIVPNGTIRLFKDTGSGVSNLLGEQHSFIVLEITNKSIQQFSVSIKSSSSDSGYISKLNSQNNYSITTGTQITLDGLIIDYHNQTKLKTNANLIQSTKNSNTSHFVDKKYLI